MFCNFQNKSLEIELGVLWHYLFNHSSHLDSHISKQSRSTAALVG